MLKIVEQVADTLAKTPTASTRPVLSARLRAGGLCGAAFDAADPTADRGAAAGVDGSIVETRSTNGFVFGW
jgi:uncharacterized membrane protein